MVFVDSLAVMLLSLGSSTFLLALYFLMNALGRKDVSKLYVPIFVFGLFDLAAGFVMSFTWPMPGAYNMLFGDPLLFLGIIMAAGGYMLQKGMGAEYLSLPGLFLGIYLAVEAAAMVNFKLETGSQLLGAFGLYALSAMAGILSPLIFLNPKKNGKAAYFLMFILLILVTLVALFIGYTGIYGHLQSPP